jgi:predicted phosphoadenosine phosphosulfate sulfurtransferase
MRNTRFYIVIFLIIILLLYFFNNIKNKESKNVSNSLPEEYIKTLKEQRKNKIEKYQNILKNKSIGFACQPEAQFGFDFLLIYDKGYVSSFHDTIVNRDKDWIISKFISYDSNAEFTIPEQRWEQVNKKVVHNIVNTWADENTYTRLNIEISKNDATSNNLSFVCIEADIKALNDFVKNRKNNLMGPRVFELIEIPSN